MPNFADEKFEDVFYVITGDLTRQLTQKGGIKSPTKTMVVGASDLIYQYSAATMLEAQLAGLTGESMISSKVAEILGTASVMWGMDKLGLVSKQSVKVEGEKSPKGSDASFMNSVSLATQDVVYGAGLKIVYDTVYPSA